MRLAETARYIELMLLFKRPKSRNFMTKVTRSFSMLKSSGGLGLAIIALIVPMGCLATSSSSPLAKSRVIAGHSAPGVSFSNKAPAEKSEAIGRRISPEDLLSVRTLSPRYNGMEISSDGHWVVFEMEAVDIARNVKISNHYVLPAVGGSEPVRLTNNAPGVGGRAAHWSPDGTVLAFFAEEGGDPGIWLARTPDFKPIRLELDLPLMGGPDDMRPGNYPADFRWSPNSREIAFTVSSGSPSPDAMVGQRFSLENESGDDLPLPAKLCTADVQSGKLDCLPAGDLNVLDFDWSPDSSMLVISASKDRSYSSYMSTDLFIIDRLSREVRPLVVQPGPDSNPVWSPDGKSVAFSTQNGNVDWLQDRWPAIVSVQGGTPRFLGDAWREMSNGTANNLRWARDSKSLYFDGNYQFGYHLFRLMIPTGEISRITRDPGGYHRATSLTADGKTLVFVKESPVDPTALYTTPLRNFRPRKIFDANPQLKTYAKPIVRMLDWASSDGKFRLEASLLLPPDYEEGTRYPLLLSIIGGPGMATNSFNFSDQYPNLIFASRGYVVMSINTRGRGGYGKAFHEAIATEESYGINPSQDLLDGVEAAVRAGIADPQSVGIIGFSYGGYLSTFAPTQTDRFKAASAGDPPLDMVEGWFGSSMYGISRPQRLRQKLLGFGDPILPAQRANAEAQSPMYQIEQIKTPVLLECGALSDFVKNCRSFYAGLRHFGTPSMLYIYPRTGHGIQEPQLLLDSYKRNLAWFDYWLLGKGSNPIDND